MFGVCGADSGVAKPGAAPAAAAAAATGGGAGAGVGGAAGAAAAGAGAGAAVAGVSAKPAAAPPAGAAQLLASAQAAGIDTTTPDFQAKLALQKWHVDESLIKTAADAIAGADAILFTSGAGLGVDGGLPDFRGPEGFWKAYPPMAKLGLAFHMMSNPVWFQKDPEFAWGFWGHRFGLYLTSVPHLGYTLMKQLADWKRHYFSFTSNVDTHWIRSGFPEERVMECHGSTAYMQCVKACKKDELWSSKAVKVVVDESTFRAAKPLPACPHCGGLARPNVMMFGDDGYCDARLDEQEAAFSAFMRSNKEHKRKLVVVEVGAGEAVPTVRHTSEISAEKLPGAFLIRINPRDPDVPVRLQREQRAVSLPMGGLAALDRMMVYLTPQVLKAEAAAKQAAVATNPAAAAATAIGAGAVAAVGAGGAAAAAPAAGAGAADAATAKPAAK